MENVGSGVCLTTSYMYILLSRGFESHWRQNVNRSVSMYEELTVSCRLAGGGGEGGSQGISWLHGRGLHWLSSTIKQSLR